MRIPEELRPILLSHDTAADRVVDGKPSADRRRPEPVDGAKGMRAPREQAPSTAGNESAAIGDAGRNQRRLVQGKPADERRGGERRRRNLPILLDTRITHSRRRDPEHRRIDTKA